VWGGRKMVGNGKEEYTISEMAYLLGCDRETRTDNSKN
jgi:hypothetical protein